MQRTWKTGLIGTAICQVLLLCGLIVGWQLKIHANSLSREFAIAQRGFEQAGKTRDISSLKRYSEQLDGIAERVQYTAKYIWVYPLFTWVALLSMVVFAWQLTSAPVSRWEKFGRVCSLLLPLAVLLKVWGKYALLTEFCTILVSIFVPIGILAAACKVARNADNSHRIPYLMRAFTFCGIAMGILMSLEGRLKLEQVIPLGVAALFGVAYYSFQMVLVTGEVPQDLS